MKIAILGSGATAYAGYLALSDQAVEVTVIDFNFVDKTKVGYLPGLAAKDHKLAHQSTHIPSIFQTRSNLESGIGGSATFGGWTNIWGATISPLTKNELGFWDHDRHVLKEHQRIIREKLKFGHPDLDFNSIDYRSGLLNHIDLESNKATPEVNIRLSDLAITPVSSSPETGCVRCSNCLKGCPWGKIWSANLGWEEFKQSGRLQYELDFWIESVIESRDKVEVRGKRDGELESLYFDKVFVALGVFQTAALMLRSKIAREIEIRDSAMFVVPFIRPFFRSTSPTRSGISLSSAFVTTNFTRGKSLASEHDFFAQLYGYSEDLEKKISARFKYFEMVPKSLRKLILSRIGIAMCFFDQTLSGTIVCNLESDGVVAITPFSPKIEKGELASIARRQLAKVKLFTLPFVGELLSPGLGFHSGASFPPDSAQRGEQKNYSDKFGRPNETQRIHLIDTSVFPRIGSSPPTFNAMVNAYSISKAIIDNGV
jgi:hypothetical protein